jgi:hypothetical protein
MVYVEYSWLHVAINNSAKDALRMNSMPLECDWATCNEGCVVLKSCRFLIGTKTSFRPFSVKKILGPSD